MEILASKEIQDTKYCFEIKKTKTKAWRKRLINEIDAKNTNV